MQLEKDDFYMNNYNLSLKFRVYEQNHKGSGIKLMLLPFFDTNFKGNLRHFLLKWYNYTRKV